MKNFSLRAVLAALLFASAGSVAAADRPVVGVILPLDGMFAGMGQDARNEIRKKLGGVADLVEMDDQMTPALALSHYKTLASDRKVILVIGPLTSAGTSAIADAIYRSDYKVPVLALAQAPSIDVFKQAQQRSVFMFTQPASQIAQLGKALSASEKILLTGLDFYSEKLNALNSVLGSRATRGPVLTEKNISDVARVAGDSKATLVYIGTRLVADEAFRQLRPTDTRVVLMSPPDPKRVASVAAAVALDWIKKGDLTNEGLRAALKRSAYFEADTGSLALAWQVDAIGKKLLASATTSSSSCTCASKDGNVNHEVPCKDPPDSCKKDEGQSDCSCKCDSK